MWLDHDVQMAILTVLLFNQKARFAQLNTTGLPNNHFNFHLKHLIEKGLVEKVDDRYQLTAEGVEIAGRLDVKRSEFVRQPKLGVYLCVTRGKNDKDILVGRRRKGPDLGVAGFFAEKVRFGESVYATAKRCLLNETGLSGNFKWAGELRLIRKQGESIIIDVIFTCFVVRNPKGKLEEQTAESNNFWCVRSEINKIPHTFSNFQDTLSLFLARKPFFKEIVAKEPKGL